MRIYDIILKKKRGEALTEEEIRSFVKSYTEGEIPDYQVSALLMAICWQGMNDKETHILTDAISKSGDTVDLSEFGTLSVDKHSTGGVGDKTTLIVAPLAASLGCKVAKMSGRGLGHTGGTVDKLEAFPGYRTELTPCEFSARVRDIGIAVVGQSGNLAPADKKLYALRDVTATVDSIPLIASSVMGKKLAAGAHTIVLDVKCGSGSFMKTPEEAERLAEAMVKIGERAGRKTSALITNMDIPLGASVGNTLELIEAISVLKGDGPSDLVEISLALAAEMTASALEIDYEEAEERAKNALSSGLAFRKFKEWITAQGGDSSFAEKPELFGIAEYSYEIKAERRGYIGEMNAEKIGLSAMELGAGRKSKDDTIDFSAGIVLKKKTGDEIFEGDTIATLYTNKKGSLPLAERLFSKAIKITDKKPENAKLIYKTVRA